MKKLLACLLLVGGVSFAATVDVSGGASIDPLNYDQSRFLIRVGNPTAQEIADFKAGQLDLVRFTSTNQVLEDAETDLSTCEAAVTTICGTLSETALACRVSPGTSCVGVCTNSTTMRITD